jgi:hypothetical protein
LYGLSRTIVSEMDVKFLWFISGKPFGI